MALTQPVYARSNATFSRSRSMFDSMRWMKVKVLGKDPPRCRASPHRPTSGALAGLCRASKADVVALAVIVESFLEVQIGLRPSYVIFDIGAAG
jgi:hypothetical protein